MTDRFTQDERTLKIDFSAGLGKDTLLLLAISGQEALSRPYSYRVEMLCQEPDRVIDPAEMIGANAGIGIRVKTENRFVARDGFVRSFQAAGMRTKRFRVYRAEIVPYLSLLEFSTDTRIFQDMTVIDVLKKVFQEFGLNLVEFRASAADYPRMEYCVQFGETSFAFVSRLMEENGIFYWFDHKPTGSVLVIGDQPTHFANMTPFDIGVGTEQEDGTAYNWEHAWDHRTGSWELGDFSFVKPADPPKGETKTNVAIPKTNKHSRYLFPQHIEITKDIARFAKIRMQQEESQIHAVTASSQIPNCAPGLRFKIKSHSAFPHEDGKSYLVTSMQFTALDKSYDDGSFPDVVAGSLTGLWSTDTAKTLGMGALGTAKDNASNVMSQKLIDVLKTTATSVLTGGLTGLWTLFSGPIISWFKHLFDTKSEYSNKFIAIPKDAVFRPPRMTPKPRAYGPHTAIVMGSKGGEKPGSTDIHTDQFGRVKVQFIWDRDAHPDGGKANTGWLRVSEGWAGGKWGMQFPPRVGQEVIVSFLDGDPDRPLITGRLYNPGSQQPFDPPSGPPAPLPPGPMQPDSVVVQTNQRRSGLKTASTPRPEGGPSRFHMLRFDDEWQKEQIVLRSQGRLDVTSFADYHETVHGNRSIAIGGKDPDTGKGGGSFFMSTGGEYDLTVTGARYESVGGVGQLSVKGDVTFDFQAGWTAVIGSAAKINASEVVIEASQKITLKVGGSFVVVGPAGVDIKGAMVNINAGGSPGSTSSADVTDPVGAGKADPGEPPNWLAIQPRGGGGGRHHHTANAHHGLVMTTRPDGTIQAAPGIVINSHDPAYVEAVANDLARMNDTPSGRALINDIGSSGQTTTIQPRPAGSTVLNTDCRYGTPPNYNDSGNASNGTGSPATVEYNPSDFPVPGTRTNAPSDVALFHEMTHADHASYGGVDNAPRTDGYDNNEEYNTIQDENQYRDERGPWPNQPADSHRHDHSLRGL